MYVYRYGKPEWNETANYVDYISQFWKIVNVRNTTTGLRKRDLSMDPIRCQAFGEDPKIGLLKSFSKFLKEWNSKENKYFKMSDETTTAAAHTCDALIEIIQ